MVNENEKSGADVLALVDDLFFQAKIVETARQLGVELRICTTPDALLAEKSSATAEPIQRCELDKK